MMVMTVWLRSPRHRAASKQQPTNALLGPMRWLLVIAMVGCGGFGCGGGPVSRGTKPIACEMPANHVADVSALPLDVELPKHAIVDLLASACRRDRWSTDAKRCFAQIGSTADIEQCRGMLVGEQQQRLEADADAMFPRRPRKP